VILLKILKYQQATFCLFPVGRIILGIGALLPDGSEFPQAIFGELLHGENVAVATVLVQGGESHTMEGAGRPWATGTRIDDHVISMGDALAERRCHSHYSTTTRQEYS